jgi:uncharacterized damage-inducible protein DinB
MTLREFFLARLKAETPVFLRVLKAIPADQLEYKPHDRCPSTQQLVWTIVAELKACIDVVKDHKATWEEIPAPPLNEMIQKYEEWANEVMNLIEKMDEKSWDEKTQFFYEGKLVSERPAGDFLWFILFDAIHHRGQLSAYLRPMGGKVPSIYGPSADEPGGV